MATNSIKNAKIFLSKTDRKLGGVFGGLAERYDIDPTLLRLAWIIVTIFTGFFPGVIGYVVAWIIIPEKPSSKKARTAERIERAVEE